MSRCGVLIGAVATWGAATVAWGAAPIEEVVVTAQKREQALADVPLTVQALDGRSLEMGRIKGLKEMIPMVPGMSLAGETSQGTEVFQLRGIAVGDVIGDATVASYIDDFAFSIPGQPYAPPSDLYDIQRVEIIKGPQGTLYGSSSLGGVIKVVTNDPDPTDFAVSAKASLADVHTAGNDYTANIMVNIPLVQDKLAIRGVFSGKQLTGFSEAPQLGIDDINDSDTRVGRVKLLYQPTERLRAVLSYWNFDGKQDWFNRMENHDPYVANETGPGQSPVEFDLYQGTLTYDFDFGTLTSSTGYIDREYYVEANGCQAALCYSQSLPGTSESFVQEIRLTSAGDGLFNWTVGLFYQDAEAIGLGFLEYTNPPGLELPGLPFSSTRDNSLTSEEYAVFAEVSANLLDGKLVPLVGLRYAHTERELRQYSVTNVPEQADPIIDAQGEDASWNDVSPRFNVSYFASDNLMTFVNVAKGFRPGALQSGSSIAALERVLDIDTEVQLDTDELWSYEVGTKWALMDRALELSLSAYYIDWSDAQLQTGYAGITGTLNIADVEGMGVDLGLVVRPPVEGLTLQFLGNINETEMKTVNPSVSAVLPFLKDGAQLPPVPEKNFTVIADYVRPIELAGTPFDFFANARYEYRDTNKDLSTGRESGELDIFAASIGIETEDYSLQLFGDNLTNERGPMLWEQARIIVPRPRTVGLQFEVFF